MQDRKIHAIGVDGEHRAIAIGAATLAAVPYRVLPDKINPASGSAPSLTASETMQGRKTRAIGVDGEHRAIAISAAIFRRPIQRVAR